MKNSAYLEAVRKRLDGLNREQCIVQAAILFNALRAGEEELARELGIAPASVPPKEGVPPKKPVGRVVPIDQERRSG